MFLFHRKSFAGIGFTAVAVASTALFAVPAQAASAGSAKVVGSSAVQFSALAGKSNSLTITISGRTVTLNDKVAIKAGKGCKAVKGDKTKVKCTTKNKTTKLSVALGDKNDWVGNRTSVYMIAYGGSGNDTLTGGSGKDQLQGGTGNDKLYGRGSGDVLFGDWGDDTLYGSTGNDEIQAGPGVDKAWGDAGNDRVDGNAGDDRMGGGTGNDTLYGSNGADTIFGDAGDDIILGESGSDVMHGGAGRDDISGDMNNDGSLLHAADTITGDAGDDFLYGEEGNDWIGGGDGDDWAFGMSDDDRVTGDAGDDVLFGEFTDNEFNQIGSDSALDQVNGGADVVGDSCYVMAAGTKADCEYPAVSGAARAEAAKAPSTEMIKAVQQAKARLAAAAAAK
jgi:Ca2+-binding RTX toxin-like protein